ncbi:MAG: hypothetical protein GY723_10140 [bacterium]|nr:hypothetical protein [bacterium]
MALWSSVHVMAVTWTRTSQVVTSASFCAWRSAAATSSRARRSSNVRTSKKRGADTPANSPRMTSARTSSVRLKPSSLRDLVGLLPRKSCAVPKAWPS